MKPHRRPAACAATLALLLLAAGRADAQADPAAPSAVAAPAQASAELAGESASQVIDDLHAQLLAVMKDAKTLGYEGRATQLGPVIPRYFDTGFMARKAVGRHWKNADDEEKRRYLDAFKRFMIANYAGQFDGWSGQRFETLSEEPSLQETVLVRTRLVNPGEEDVALDYRMRRVEGGWKIVDVYLDGTVSELARRRSEFSSIVKNDDFDALIAALDDKIAKLAAGDDSDA